MSKDFLLEILTEDLPARYVDIGIKQLKQNAESQLTKNELSYEAFNVYGSPRRLILHIKSLQELQGDKVLKKTGPSKKIALDAQGNFTKAALGFARSAGVEPDALIFKPNEKGEEFLYIEQEIKGKNVKELFSEILSYLFSKFNFPKSMYWNETKFMFPRPLRGLLILFGDEKIDFSIAGVSSDLVTYGHRFLSDNKKITISSIDDYFQKLNENFVIYDKEKRKDFIQKEGTKAVKGKVKFDDSLLNTVANLIEYPVIQVCEFDKKFLDLPSEIIVLEMKEHQKYFSVFDENGKLTNEFLVILNNTSNQYTKEGNERVLTARLKDAEFFIQEDLKVKSLDEYNVKLTGVLQHEKIGTLKDKSDKIVKIAEFISDSLQLKERESVLRAALLCKSDLVTNAVFEFTELQGIIGGEYARRLGEPEEVALGIAEHYKPIGVGDDVPSQTTGAIVALSDKIDTVVGGFSADLKPTSSKDPYQIKRAAFGIIRILIEKELKINLKELILFVLELYSKQDDQLLFNEIMNFFKTRVSTVLKDHNITKDEVDAILSVDFSNISDAYLRISVLHNFREQADFNDLILGLKRMDNILKEASSFQEIDENLLTEKAEKDLYAYYMKKNKIVSDLIQSQEYEKVFQELSSFKSVVDKFFDDVLVMDKNEKVKQNRLSLLHSIVVLFKSILDFEKIVGKK